ncbi:Guanine nucleotide-binding protein alpha-4 subunit [Hypsizygus marmoreus]|uniref:Guanine nucleotide-binding protein alpha-4 subunit n=1 Tax=Hypsizygus marmoreus TaxID=39966 RepID=A0A369K746_HYPMA|nr:Guanine nucleotide-binding protein alpha-4 subunit [Hypsizygus marmoreus]
MTMPVPQRPSDDPLDEVLRPPPDETPEQRELRLAREEEAQRISLAIDASIKAEKQARKKRRIVRLLLLGQSESGKSTTLRQFQRLYTPTAFREERILWRAVIQLNIVRSIRIILETLSSPTQKSPKTSPYSSPRSRARSISRPPPIPAHIPPLPSSDYTNDADFGNGDDFHSSRARVDSGGESDPESDSDMLSRSNPSSTTLISSPLEALKTRLLPLRHIEALLIAKLVPPNEDEATHLAGPSHSTYPPGHQNGTAGVSFRNQEIFVRPGAGWKGALSKARVNYPSYSGSNESPPSPETGRPTSAGNTGLETPDEPQEVLHSCRKDMIMLWNDEVVREILNRKKVRLEELPGFFLNDLERVTSLKYMPTDDDVLKARLKTVGVSEYKFEMEVSAGRDSGTEWRIVDVGGSRSQRPTWAPFFDDGEEHTLRIRFLCLIDLQVDAIIFLAPISGFDQVLAEDRTVNRLEDSVLLWKSVCSNKLLANVDLVLFLNKCDILEAKLKSGIKLSRYVKSYSDRDNDLDSVSKYLRGKFSAIHREYSPNPRKFYAFCTSVTDTATTAGIIASVRDMVIRQHLKQSKLL